MQRLIHELRSKHPKLVLRAQRTPVAGIRLFCMECIGGSKKDVRECSTTECPLNPFRMGKRPKTQSK